MRKEIVDSKETFSISRQCKLLNLTRSSLYYKAALRKRFDIIVGHRKVGKYMNLLRIAAIYPKKNLSIPNKEHKKYPYLLRNLQINRNNQVWSTDITYIRLKKGFIY